MPPRTPEAYGNALPPREVPDVLRQSPTGTPDFLRIELPELLHPSIVHVGRERPRRTEQRHHDNPEDHQCGVHTSPHSHDVMKERPDTDDEKERAYELAEV